MKLIWCQICPPLNVPLKVSLGRKGKYGLEVTLWSLQDGTVLFGHCPAYVHIFNSFSWVITITSWWQCLSLESNFPFTPWLPSSQSLTYGVLLLFPGTLFVMVVNLSQIGILHYEFHIRFRKTCLNIFAPIQREVLLCSKHTRNLPLLGTQVVHLPTLPLFFCLFSLKTLLSPLVK